MAHKAGHPVPYSVIDKLIPGATASFLFFLIPAYFSKKSTVSKELFSRQKLAGSEIDLVPLLTAHLKVGAGGDLGHVLRVHRARDRLHLCRVAQDPRHRDRCLAKAVRLRGGCERGIDLREVRIVNKRAADHAVLQR